jgi:hypothetical protein
VEPEQKPLTEINVDTANLYKEETFTDLQVATLRRMVPVKVDGTPDDSRPVLFMGETQLMSARGPLPVTCPIEASTLEEAIEKFPDAVNVTVEKMIEQAREMQRQEASRIVVPGQGPGPKISLT